MVKVTVAGPSCGVQVRTPDFGSIVAPDSGTDQAVGQVPAGRRVGRDGRKVKRDPSSTVRSPIAARVGGR